MKTAVVDVAGGCGVFFVFILFVGGFLLICCHAVAFLISPSVFAVWAPNTRYDFLMFSLADVPFVICVLVSSTVPSVHGSPVPPTAVASIFKSLMISVPALQLHLFGV